jgi:putative sigma-54 modulation protein
MSIDDVLLKMETTKNHFLVYRDSLTENVNLIYRRDDGKFVLLETSR